MHLQVFVIFNLPSYSFSLIHLYQEPFSILYFFFHHPTWLRAREKRRCQAEYARVSLRPGGRFFSSYQKLSRLLPNCWRGVFNVFAKNQGCQLDLANRWRCSEETVVVHILWGILKLAWSLAVISYAWNHEGKEPVEYVACLLSRTDSNKITKI